MAMLLERMNQLTRALAVRLRTGERGATVVEYSLLIVFIAMVSMMALEYFGGSTGASMSRSHGSMFEP